MYRDNECYIELQRIDVYIPCACTVLREDAREDAQSHDSTAPASRVFFDRGILRGQNHMTILYPKAASPNTPRSPRRSTATQQSLDEQAAFFAPLHLPLVNPWLRWQIQARSRRRPGISCIVEVSNNLEHRGLDGGLCEPGALARQW